MPSRPATAQQLEAKVAELKALQREIDELRQAIAQEQQIIVSLKCIEVNRTKMTDIGFDAPSFTRRANDRAPLSAGAVSGLIESLLELEIAKVLSEPTLLIRPGCKGLFFSGGEIPLPSKSGKVEYQKYGTEVEVLGAVTPEQRIRLEIRMQNTEIAASGETDVDDKKYPRLNRRIVDTGVEIASGETIVLHGPTERKDQVVMQRDGVEEKSTIELERLWLVKAELVNSTALPPTPMSAGKVKPTSRSIR
jgi:Flp pilus assembly secretin CpaC